MNELRKPFPLSAHQFRPGATSGDRALALTYVDSRWYQHQLDETGVEWSDDMELMENGKNIFAVCRLTIDGVTRSACGEAGANERNAATTASVQAFKRACVKFGLGRYLYFVMDNAWADYNPSKQRFTKRGMKELKSKLKKQLERLNRDE